MAESGSSQGGYTGDYGGSVAVREQDRFVPITDISWIMSKAIPGNARISKDAKEFMQKCVSNFISFVTIEASNKCQREKRKIINGDDLVWAMAALGCYEYVRPLRFNLQLYREQAELNVDPGESGRSGVCDASEEDRKQYMFLPITNIGRIMRKAIPENCKISKGAKESVQECASEFISFVTCEANYKCLQERRKALDGEDVVNAMATLGFDEYVEPLKQYLQLYREAEGSCKGSLSAAKSKRYGASNGDPGAAYNGM